MRSNKGPWKDPNILKSYFFSFLLSVRIEHCKRYGKTNYIFCLDSTRSPMPMHLVSQIYVWMLKERGYNMHTKNKSNFSKNE